jgi:hypothetical protein
LWVMFVLYAICQSTEIIGMQSYFYVAKKYEE